MQQPFSILFICLGNICRSPLAEGVMRSVLKQRYPNKEFIIDSAGTNNYHIGEAPDARSVTVAAQHNVDIAGHRCRQIETSDFYRFDLILAMDQKNLMTVNRLAPSGSPAKTGLFTAIARDGLNSQNADYGVEIPDPYYGTDREFEQVYHMIYDAAKALAERLEHIFEKAEKV